ncbi:GNAT family N-acetyltransferase [Massilia sp. R2A-15]|uniref:GNAT family N-acetyltransferase n=1 Tax=Massilia sp. R2A-15 TaxID=3064278 RepID=UPI002734AF72|nr:GNAT family N-acetyltransferase [Massilia sp. R2A-15]WLI90227.1 GNAT family N-acetyltransferase [Massilia sp. R2A-15]
MTTLETPNLYLRRFTLDDAQAYLPLVSMPEVLRYIGEPAQTSVEGARQILLNYPMRHYEVHGFGRMACVEKSSGRLVGFSGLKFVEHLQEVDIGYRFLPECWGKGYATESARALLQDGVRTHRLERIVGLVMPENLASARVLSKLGLSFERTIREDDTDVHLYACQVGVNAPD